MAANKGLINIFKNGAQEPFYPKSIYESILKTDGSGVTLKQEIEALQTFEKTASAKLDGIAEGANNYVHPSTPGNKHIPAGGAAGQILKYSGQAGTAVWAEETNTTYDVATAVADGLMSSEDKTKLDGIDANANNYVHPNTAGNKHIPAGGSTGQVLRWSAEGTAVWGQDNDTKYGPVSTTANGLMTVADKKKLDGIAEGANKYIHPDNTNTRHVTDAEKAGWSAKETTEGAQAKATAALQQAKAYADEKVSGLVGTAPEALDTLKELAAALGDDPNFAATVAEQIGTKVDKVPGKQLSTNDFTTEEKQKLAGIAAGANNYVHPNTTGNKHIPAGGSTGQILKWSASGTAEWAEETNIEYEIVSKQGAGLVPQLPDEVTTTKYLRQDGQWEVPPNTTYNVATQMANGLMSSGDKTKLDGIAANANNYVHPNTAGNKHIPADGASGQILQWSEAGTAKWADAPSFEEATGEAAGLMSAADKKKLDGVAVNANNYVHPNTAGNKHIPAGGAAGQILKYSDAGTAVWAAEKTYAPATTKADGLMSMADKTKLDGIDANANNYVHPGKHDATIITETADKRFVSDAEKATWNGKASTAVASGTANGLMSSGDKTKLDGIAANANNYVHPNTAGNKHIPTGGALGQILQWSEAGTAKWADAPSFEEATGELAGLMSAADKKKLDGVAVNANNYVHPNDINTRHVTDAEKAGWNAKETTDGAQAKATAALQQAKSYADEKVAGIVGTAPETLDTLKELAAALGDDPNFAATIAEQIGAKVDKVPGKQLSTNDYTTAEKQKLAGIAANANNYVHPTGAGNLHIPAGGSAGQILRWTAAGTAEWGADKDTTYSVVSGTSNGLMSSADKTALDTMKTENAALKKILAMIANMNGSELDLGASMTQITEAFTTLYEQVGTSQFVYAELESVGVEPGPGGQGPV